jgi:penicillin-binding protein 1A
VPPAQAALVSIDPATREIVALVGSYEAQRGGFNRAIQATRQVGSTFKAFVYAAALEQRLITPATVYLDQPFTARIAGQPDWRPANYDGEYLGPMSARQALASSRNVIAVRVLEQLGIAPMHEFAARVGSGSPLVDNLTLALGSAEMTPLELTNMFTTFAAGGVVGEPVMVRRVLDSRGELVWAPEPPAAARVLDPAVTWLTTSMLQSVVTSGTGGAAQRVGHPIAGKTGTTNGARDAWFVGYSRTLVTGVWVGRDDNTELGRRESGGRAALPIFTAFMTRALTDVAPDEILPRPENGLVDVLIDPATGLRANEGREGAIIETFLAGTEPREFAPEAGSQPARDVLFRGQDAPAGGSGEPAPPPQGTLDEF